MENKPSSTSSEFEVKYQRIPHAGHYGPKKGHDIESWDVRSPRRPNPRPPEIPGNAQFHVGYRDAGGNQWWSYTRVAPLTGTCNYCEGVSVGDASFGLSTAFEYLHSQRRQ